MERLAEPRERLAPPLHARVRLRVTSAIADETAARTGRRPHLVISHLHRIKLDPNREIVEAAHRGGDRGSAQRAPADPCP